MPWTNRPFDYYGTSPTQILDDLTKANDNFEILGQAFVGNDPTTQKVKDADKVDGYHASQTPAANQIPVVDANSNLTLPANLNLTGNLYLNGLIQPYTTYPQANVTLLQLAVIGKVKVYGADGSNISIFIGTTDSFADKAFQCFLLVGGGSGTDVYVKVCVGGRVQGHRSYTGYIAGIATGAPTADFGVIKYVTGTATALGTEAVDIAPGTEWTLKISCLGTTIKGYRANMTTPKISVTDTSIASGSFGGGASASSYNEPPLLPYLLGTLLDASSPSPKLLAIFEVPIVGSGTTEDPFRPQLPEDIVPHPFIPDKKVNRLAITASFFIPTDEKGQPLSQTAIVRVFEQPDRMDYLHPIDVCLDVIRKQNFVKELSPEEAIKKALKIDEKLHPFDLIGLGKHSPTEKDLEEYFEHRKKVFNIEMEENLLKQYLSENKSWGIDFEKEPVDREFIEKLIIQRKWK